MLSMSCTVSVVRTCRSSRAPRAFPQSRAYPRARSIHAFSTAADVGS